jgi:hypothetical protein
MSKEFKLNVDIGGFCNGVPLIKFSKKKIEIPKVINI